MAIASLINVEKHFGKKVLFEHLDLTVYEGERVGFIGANGAGKTTLFRMLTGEEKPDAGTVTIARGTKVGYLVQNPQFDLQSTVMDEAELAFADLHRLSHQMRDLEHRMADAQGDALEKVLEKYQNAQHEFDLAGGYAWQHRLEATLLGVGLGRETWEQKVAVLSGGQRSRLALSKLLLSEPDLLLLDEPTNHLDLAAIEWLEDYLKDFAGSVVIISHDRYLLDRLASRIVWLNRSQIDSYTGNYSSYVEQRELNELTQQRAYELQQKDIAKQEEFIRRFKAGQRSKEAKGRERRLDRLKESGDVIRPVGVQQKINLSLNTTQRAGDRVLQVRELGKSFGENRLWDDVSVEISRGERIGIIGHNGTGKTTLLKVLMDLEPLDAGTVKWGANLKIGYYDQRLDVLKPHHTLMDALHEGRIVNDKACREVLGLMLFRTEDMEKTIDLLSGGEKARVRLAQLLVDKPNVLVLDEPTNHLDIASREALETALGGFEGTILCVSHDRYFLDRVVERLWVLTPPTLLDFDGNYSAWTQKQKAMAAQAKQAARPVEAEEEMRRRAFIAGRAALAEHMIGMRPIDPATEQPLEDYPEHGDAQVQSLLDRAGVAYQNWRRTPLLDRGRLMHRTAQVLRERKAELASLMMREMGKPIVAAEGEIEKCADCCEHFAIHSARYLAEIEIESDATRSYVRFDPLGAVLAIMPWNFPFWQVFRFAAPALMAGNAGVLKHAPNVPGCALAIENVFRAAGFPPGVFTTVLVDTPAVADIVKHPAIAAVTLTGSDRAGSSVAALAGAALKKTVLELGGSDPFVVLPDADLDATAKSAASARTINSGQSCIAAKRFIVVGDSRPFEAHFAQALSLLKVGNPAERDTQLGPIARLDLLENLHRQVRDSIRAGARLVIGGRRLARTGYFYPPTLLADVHPGMPAFDEETFGPVAALVQARDEDDAIRLANLSPYGLGASIWSRDASAAERMAARLDAGCVFINGIVKSDPRLPFGGVKRSGYGRELSTFGIHEFVNAKTVWVRDIDRVTNEIAPREN